MTSVNQTQVNAYGEPSDTESRGLAPWIAPRIEKLNIQDVASGNIWGAESSHGQWVSGSES